MLRSLKVEIFDFINFNSLLFMQKIA